MTTGWGMKLGLVAAFGLSVHAWGWGSYGHEQVSAAALDLMKDSPLRACLVKNRDTILRLSVTPDFDWKSYGAAPSDPELAALKEEIDSYEHPLHFMDADAFVKPSPSIGEAIAALPAGPFLVELETYAKKLVGNWDFVTLVKPNVKVEDPAAPTAAEVAAFGTAPWRVAQLFKIAKKALAAHDDELALIALGTLSHYVADMSQPYHASLIYDGQYPDPEGKGVHSAFESQLLELYAKDAGAWLDKETRLWSSFDATDDAVKAFAATKSVDKTIDTDRIVSEVFALMGPGHEWVAPLTEAFIEAKSGRKVSAGVLMDFSEKKITAPKAGAHSVREVAMLRLADGAVLLARLWNAAYSPEASHIGNCESPGFPEAAVFRRYPKPDYLVRR